MGNFLEIDLFVTVTCPEKSFLDAKEYMVPVITPYELIVGLDPAFSWNYLEYEIDCRKLGSNIEKLEQSLLNSTEGAELVDTRYEKGIVKDAAEFLDNRQFKGLEINDDEPVSLLEQGRVGIARGYTHEE